jgi:hypothetical protein
VTLEERRLRVDVCGWVVGGWGLMFRVERSHFVYFEIGRHSFKEATYLKKGTQFEEGTRFRGSVRFQIKRYHDFL